MSERTITRRRDGAIERIRLDRAEAGNMLTIDMIAALTGMIAEAGRDPDVKAIAVSAAGEDFCRGRDPAGTPEAAPRTALQMRARLTAPILGYYAAVRDAEVPVVASVQGRASGFGCAASAVCDVTIAAHDSRFSLPEMRHDLPPTLAMCAHIDRTMPKAIAWLVYSTDEIDAETARGLGFVSRVAAPGALAAETESLLASLAGRDRESLATCKRYLARARLMETGNAADYAGNLLSVVMSSRLT